MGGAARLLQPDSMGLDPIPIDLDPSLALYRDLLIWPRLLVAVQLATAAGPTRIRRGRGRGLPHDVVVVVAEVGGMIMATMLVGEVLVAAATTAIMVGIDPAVGAEAASLVRTDDALHNG